MTQLGSNVQLGSNTQMGIDPGFTPLWLSGCVAWFDMQDPRSYALTGSTVTSITNKASGVAWTEVTNPPDFSATGFNSQPCMTFNGTTQKDHQHRGRRCHCTSGQHGQHGHLRRKDEQPEPCCGAVVFGGGVGTGTNLRNINYWGMTGRRQEHLWRCQRRGCRLHGAIGGDRQREQQRLPVDNTGTAASLYTNGGAADPSAAAANSASCNPTRYAIGCIPTVTPQGFWNGTVRGDLDLQPSVVER